MHAYNISEEKIIMSSFDTLQFAKRAEQAGFTKQQAEFQAEEMAKIIDNHIATKEDVADVQIEVEIIKADIKDLKIEVGTIKTEIEKMKLEIEKIKLEMKAMENRIVIKMGGMLTVAVGVLATILTIF